MVIMTIDEITELHELISATYAEVTELERRNAPIAERDATVTAMYDEITRRFGPEARDEVIEALAGWSRSRAH